ncbi:hypothetical protein SpAn4DRAFT_5203 [Sporomusa ovata]|uniref:Uncharacterized protein n=1 Tax=Sporomusa ovata TaxID=2378 RepID=A0A0U1KX14_9FIRM|nr:hypothetical protein [Sporomusa ovata]CQR71962.1 hypothetical protein SpAn4DRAFT_5203 [Sporomusa ovata]
MQLKRITYAGQLSEELDRLDKEGKDTTDTIQRFGEVMEEFLYSGSREAKTC